MTALMFGILILLLSVLGEAWTGAYGFLFPLGAVTVFYLTVVYGWRAGLVVAFVAAAGIDMIFMRSGLPSLPEMLVAVLLGMFWLWRADSRQIMMRLLPGLVIGVVATGPAFLGAFRRNAPTPDMILQNTLAWLFSLLVTAVFALMGTLLYDWLAENLGLDSFEKARERFIHNNR